MKYTQAFSQIFSVLIMPVVGLVGLVSVAIYALAGLGGTPLGIVLWYVVYGHIVASILTLLVVGLPLTILVVVLSGVIAALTMPFRK